MLVKVLLVLPYLLRLPNGAYPTDAEGRIIYLLEQYLPEHSTKRTTVSAEFDAPAGGGLEQQLVRQNREAEALLKQANRLIRWYRSETRQAAVVEVTKAQASPFVFIAVDTKSSWGDALSFEADPPALPLAQSISSIAKSVRAGMAGGNDPEVSRLFLLDAEQALQDGRFREAVLFCWSTIDATFNTKYEQLVDQTLTGEWAAGRDWLKDTRFGMKNKMTAILFLLTGQSLFRGSGDLWQKLDQSYKKRNSIIHRGEMALEADAELALSVARTVVELMASLKPKKPSKKRD